MAQKYNDVWVIIPVYNEGSVVKNVVDKVSKKFSNVVCVNDGSIDNSLEELLKTRAHIVNHPINLGQGASLQTGIDYSRQDQDANYFVTFDADGQHRLADVENMIDIIKCKDYNIVIGSRFMGEAKNISSAKKILLKLAVYFTNKTTGLSLTDAHNGLRVFDRHVADTLDIQMSDFSHASEIVEKISINKYKYCEAPVTIKYTDYSKAKGQSMFNAINIGFDVIMKKFL